MIIEGIICPIGERNSNGWGISEEDVESLIKKLYDFPIRKCQQCYGDHGCEYTGDTRSEIGKPVKIWRDGNHIKVRALISNSNARKMIEEGKYDREWSLAGFGNVGDDGLTHGSFKPTGLTIVKKGAWDGAKYRIVAAEDNKNLVNSGDFKMDDAWNEVPAKLKDLDQKIDDLNKKLDPPKKDEEKLKSDDKPPVPPTKEEIENSDAIMAELNGLKKEREDLKKQLENALPKETVEKLMEKHADEAVKKYDSSIKKEKAIADYTAAIGGKLTDDEKKMLDSMTVEHINHLTNKIKTFSSKEDDKPTYASRYEKIESERGLSVGEWDPIKKEWVS